MPRFGCMRDIISSPGPKALLQNLVKHEALICALRNASRCRFMSRAFQRLLSSPRSYLSRRPSSGVLLPKSFVRVAPSMCRRNTETRRSRGDVEQALDMKRHRLALAGRRCSASCFHQVLQQAWVQSEEMMSRMHPKRGIHDELERFRAREDQ